MLGLKDHFKAFRMKIRYLRNAVKIATMITKKNFPCKECEDKVNQ